MISRYGYIRQTSANPGCLYQTSTIWVDAAIVMVSLIVWHEPVFHSNYQK